MKSTQLTYSRDGTKVMALKGNIKDFSITQLLNLVNLAKKTGILRIKGPEKSATIAFRDGKLEFAELSGGKNDIGSVLYINKIISTAQFSTLKRRASNMNDKELGLLLINAGYVTYKEIMSSIQNQSVSIIQQLFSWAEGHFVFSSGEKMPEGKIPVKMNLENIILESSRKMQELETLKEELPNLDLALRFSDRPGINIQNIDLSADEWRVVSFVKPENTIRQIAKATKLTENEIRRIVFGLLQAGLIELIRLEPKEEALPELEKAMPGKTKDEQKNIIQRLINRIRSS